MRLTHTAIGRAWSNEDGAVTVDWVVLTAGCVMLGMAMVPPVQQGVQALNEGLKPQLVADLPTIVGN